jgi:hypothetical protein
MICDDKIQWSCKQKHIIKTFLELRLYCEVPNFKFSNGEKHTSQILVQSQFPIVKNKFLCTIKHVDYLNQLNFTKWCFQKLKLWNKWGHTSFLSKGSQQKDKNWYKIVQGGQRSYISMTLTRCLLFTFSCHS